MRKVIYTCVAGTTERPGRPRCEVKGYEWICFTDKPFLSKVWQCQPLLKEFDDPQLTARYHKTIGCNFLDCDLALWQDGKITIQLSPDLFFEELGEHAIGLMHHPFRKCLYHEARQVIHIGKANPTKVKRQIAKYRADGHPENTGLYETGVMIRNPKKCVNLNEAWWAEMESHTARDQISLPYVLRKLGTDFTLLSARYEDGLFFTVKHHFFVNLYRNIKIL